MVMRRPVLQRYTFHTTVTVTILQNARRTPGDSARLARVELSEKAITRPTTASAPSAFAPGVSGRAGEIAMVMKLDGTRGASGPADGNEGTSNNHKPRRRARATPSEAIHATIRLSG